ncbi:MAG TPA: Maf family protein [Stellaceae bacterium]|nr:Maf family protein [Stellaceae bacterium]
MVLASASAARARLLHAAGIGFDVMPAVIDEAALKAACRGRYSADACALMLASEKALRVSRSNPQALVLGADQILVCESEWFDKPADLAAARAQLQVLRGRTHFLETAVCAICGGELLWRFGTAPRLTMRRFDDGFLDNYLAIEGEAVLGSVGGYRLEAGGIQLFEAIDGDYFAILGLPLLEVLGFLRRCGVIDG